MNWNIMIYPLFGYPCYETRLLMFPPLFCSGGYDHVPVDSMQGLDIGSQHGGPGSNYGPIDPRDLPPGHPGHPDLTFDQQAPPQPPRDNNQMAAWYDTDL